MLIILIMAGIRIIIVDKGPVLTCKKPPFKVNSTCFWQNVRKKAFGRIKKNIS